MSGDRDWGWNTKVDGLEVQLQAKEVEIRRLRAEQAEILTELDRLQVDMADGDRGWKTGPLLIWMCPPRPPTG